MNGTGSPNLLCSSNESRAKCRSRFVRQAVQAADSGALCELFLVGLAADFPAGWLDAGRVPAIANSVWHGCPPGRLLVRKQKRHY